MATIDGSPAISTTDKDSFYSCESPAPEQSLADVSLGDNVPESSEDFVTSSSITEKLVGIKLPDFSFPKSQYSQMPPLPITNERAALNSLLASNSRDRCEDEDFDLDDFTIYRVAGGPHSNLMIPLHGVAAKLGTTTFLFDGILTNGNERKYLQRVPFTLVSIGGYENVNQHSIGLDLWIQSIYNRKRTGIWYRLQKPAAEYSRFHEAFLWLANLAKHLVDYISENKKLTLIQLKRDFLIWLRKHHGGDPDFELWASKHGSMDFRQAVVAHGDYLYKQAVDINAQYGNCQLWNEIGTTSSIVKEQPKRESHTVVTPYVYDCFKHMDWAHHLRSIDLVSEARTKQRKRLENLDFIRKRKTSTPKISARDGLKYASILRDKSIVSCGDVIAITRDTDTVWKGNHDDLWYALVQYISQNRKGRVWLHVIWLYKPSDTVCANMVYPFKNELFMSDHCNCADSKIEATEVVQKVNVSFFSGGTNLKSDVDFFIRQSYHSEDETFVTLKNEDFCCSCRRKTPASGSGSGSGSDSAPIPIHNYTAGDTVLVETIFNDDMILEPAEIINVDKIGGNIEIRELLRRERDFKDSQRQSQPNELIYTNRFREIHIDQIDRKCHVRLYTQADLENGSIPAPYNRDGNGDAFYIICQEGGSRSLEPVQPSSVTFKQGFSSTHRDFSRLRALNIFSGGGSFDRGLEEGSAIQNEWAVEWGTMPILTYRANHPEPEKLKLFCGSVNDYLSMAIRGKGGGFVAQIGQPNFLSAGSPCQGYSMVNSQKVSEGSLRNCSMIASVMAFVDLYRFKYGLLENVTAMANKTIKKNPLSQILCCLVGMGYQCRILNLDAWSFGAPQSRSRLFVSFAAPGLKLPEHPELTHSHPVSVRNRSLGQAANGLPFGRRRRQTHVFEFVTAAKATQDLPEASIMCTSKPDHRGSRGQNVMTQTRINQIPKAPRLQGLANAVKRGTLNQTDIDSMPKSSRLATKGSRAWSRIHPHGLIPTVTTTVNPACRFTGRWLHWEEDRLLTILEARRAQGYPDDEVLVGTAANQWKIVGNSVARQVALALGLSLREACLANEKQRQLQIGQSVVGDIEGDVDESAEQADSTSILDDDTSDDAMDEAVETSSRFQKGEGVPKSRIAVEITSRSYDASSRSTKSTRTTPTITEPSSRDEGLSNLVSSKRLSPFVISDDEDELVAAPSKRRKRSALPSTPNTAEDPIMLD